MTHNDVLSDMTIFQNFLLKSIENPTLCAIPFITLLQSIRALSCENSVEAETGSPSDTR